MGLGTIAAVAGIGSSVAGIAGSLGAGDEQASAAQGSADQQLKMYAQTRADLLPYSQGGQAAFGNLQNMLGIGGVPNTQAMTSALQQYPGYQFALGEGNQALDRSAASRGALYSGGQLKDLTAYNQGMATNLFDSFYNKQAGLANLGENAAAQTGNAGSAAANAFGNYNAQAGAAGASGIAGATNAFQGLLNNSLKAYTAFNTPSPTSGGGGGGGGDGGWGSYTGDFSEFG